MPYREAPPQPKAGKRALVRSYLDIVAAELARVELQSRNIDAVVVQTASFNPMLVGATGGHRLFVDAADLERADELLRRVETNVELTDVEPEGTVRCPRCEGAYCRHGRPPLTLLHLHLVPVLFIALPYWLLARKRWYCERCDHVWDDPGQGPSHPTPIDPADPRPVFLLWRGRAGTGIFFGAIAALVVAVVLEGALATLVAVPALLFVGWFFGRVAGTFVCSEPSCRAPLQRLSKQCPKCRGSVAGRVRWGAEHYAATADFRRELAEAVARPARKKGARLQPAPKVR